MDKTGSIPASKNLALQILPILLVGVLATPQAWAQSTLYKVRLKNGSILLTDVPPPDAQILEKIAPGSRPSSAAPLPAPAPQRQTELDMRLQSRQAQMDLAQQQIEVAEQELAQAKRALEEGRQPQENEVRALAGGGARVLPEYEERLRGLERAVETAELNVKRAYELRNATR